MKVKEKFSELFTMIEEIENLLIFEFVDSETMDQMYLFKYGNRELTENAIDFDIDVIVKIIVGTYGKYWNDYFTTITEGIEGMKNFTETITETIQDEGSINFNRNSLNKVSAYNVDDFVDDSSNDDVEVSETENLKIREYEIKKLKDIGSYDKVIEYLNKNNIYDMIFNNVNRQLLKMKIY